VASGFAERMLVVGGTTSVEPRGGLMADSRRPGNWDLTAHPRRQLETWIRPERRHCRDVQAPVQTLLNELHIAADVVAW